MDEKLLFPL